MAWRWIGVAALLALMVVPTRVNAQQGDADALKQRIYDLYRQG